MGIYLNAGNIAFKMSVNDDIYVDKSNIISFVNNRIDKNRRYIYYNIYLYIIYYSSIPFLVSLAVCNILSNLSHN